MHRAHLLVAGLAFTSPAVSFAVDPDVVMAPGNYSGDQTHAGRTIIRNGTVQLTNGRFTSSPVVIVEDTGVLSVRSFVNPVFPNVLELRGGVIREREELGVNVLRLGSGASEAEFEGHPFNITRLERNPGATLFLDPSGPINPGTGRAFRIAQRPPQMFGGGGSITTWPIAPWAAAFGDLAERSFVKYNGGAFHALNPATEYATSLPAGVSANVRLTGDASSAGAVTVNSLMMTGSALTLDGPLTLTSGGLMFNPGTTGTGRISGGGSLVLPAEGFVHAYVGRQPINPPAATYTIDVPVSGGMLTKTGNGTLSLTQSNTYTGGTTINEGSVVVRTAASLGSGPVRFAGGTLTLQNSSNVPNDLILQSYSNPIPPLRTLQTSGAAVLGGRISGDGLLTLGSTTRITGGGAETGAYEVRVGSPLTITGDLASPDSIVVAGALFGSGAARGIVSAGATVSPGDLDDGVGRLTVGDAYFGGSNSRLQFDLAGNDAGTTYDQLVVLDALRLDEIFRATGRTPAELFVRMAGNYRPSPGESFTIIDNRFTGPVGPGFEFRPEGMEFLAGFTPFRITYAGGDGNDVVLTVVPEPAGAALLLPAAAVALRRRRSRLMTN